MARKDRTGNRKTREQRQPLKIPELGYYLVITDTEATERCYFQGLYKELPKEIQNKLVIKVVETKTRTMIEARSIQNQMRDCTKRFFGQEMKKKLCK